MKFVGVDGGCACCVIVHFCILGISIDIPKINTGRWGVDWSGLRYVSSVNVVLIWDISVTFGCISPAGYNV